MRPASRSRSGRLLIVGPSHRHQLAGRCQVRVVPAPTAMASLTGFTTAGEFVGTLDHVAPERTAGRPVDGRSGQCSLACMLHEALTGAPPSRCTDHVVSVAALPAAPARSDHAAVRRRRWTPGSPRSPRIPRRSPLRTPVGAVFRPAYTGLLSPRQVPTPRNVTVPSHSGLLEARAAPETPENETAPGSRRRIPRSAPDENRQEAPFAQGAGVSVGSRGMRCVVGPFRQAAV